MIIRIQDLSVVALLDIAQAILSQDEDLTLREDVASLAEALIRMNPVICEFDLSHIADTLSQQSAPLTNPTL